MPRADAPSAVQIRAGPSPSLRMTREANSEPTSDPTPPAEMTMPSRNGGRLQVLDEVDRVQDAVERAGHVGDDRAQRDREEHPVVADEPQALDDLVPDRRGSVARRPRQVPASG